MKSCALRTDTQYRITGGKRAGKVAPLLARNRLFYLHARIAVPAALQYTGRGAADMTYWARSPRLGMFVVKQRRKTYLYIATVCALLPAPARADARQDVMSAMQRCAVLQDDRTWLECTYGAQQIMRAKLGLTPAPDYQQRLVPPASAASASPPPPVYAPPQPYAAPPPARAAAAAPARRRGSFMQILGGTAPPVAVSTLAAISYDSQGAFVATLQNGQVWHQVNGLGAKARLRIGTKVTIRPGALWSYNMQAEDSGTYKVERRS